jgi:6-phosphogluconate dehydrogenase
MVGLGRMGMNMSRRLLKGQHRVVVFDLSPEKMKQLESEGAMGVRTLNDLVEKMTPRRVIWLMLPAGKAVNEAISELSKLLSAGDIIIDGGNSHYRDDIDHFEKLKSQKIGYLDIGVSGGIWGLEKGYCLMVGGEQKNFKLIEPLLKTLAPKDGYMYCGPTGAGHFVKMVHNGIEYALMEAYAEGFELIKNSPYGKNLHLGKLAHLWNHGSVIRSWLLELLQNALKKDPELSSIKSYVEDTGEGRWTVEEAIKNATPVPVLAYALFERFRSRQKEAFSDKILAVLRSEFGGHPVKSPKNQLD